ncbi:uncharacterized protein V1516DRAFT_678235 [Lipomyces oligophaga]|uniref:uncharacterized protein n=1 Tax=Lipomyces oligophaga TaxID=45792 RepID=UPI0034CEE46D
MEPTTSKTRGPRASHSALPYTTASTSTSFSQISSHAPHAHASSIDNDEWILFSAQDSTSSALDELAARADYDDDEVDTEQDLDIEFDERDIPTPVRRLTTRNTSFSFPQLDTLQSLSASYDYHHQFPLAASPSRLLPPPHAALSADEITARINAWRLDQSQAALRRMRRLKGEQSIAESASSSVVDSELVKDDASLGSSIPDPLSESESEDGVGFDYIDSHDIDQAVVAAASSSVSYNVLYSSSLSTRNLQPPSSSSFETTHAPRKFSVSSNISDETTSPLQQVPSSSFWQRLTRTVIHNIIGINDDVLDALFRSDRPSSLYATSLATRTNSDIEVSSSARLSDRPGSILSSSSSNRRIWEDRLIQRISKELALRYCRDYGSVEFCTGLFV